jgi:hypothetical protein
MHLLLFWSAQEPVPNKYAQVVVDERTHKITVTEVEGHIVSVDDRKTIVDVGDPPRLRVTITEVPGHLIDVGDDERLRVTVVDVPGYKVLTNESKILITVTEKPT